MEKVVPLFKLFNSIFYLKKFRAREVHLLIQSIQIRLIFLNKSKTSLFITDRAQSQMAHNGHALGRPPPLTTPPPLFSIDCCPRWRRAAAGRLEPHARSDPVLSAYMNSTAPFSYFFSLSRELVVAATMSLQQTRQRQAAPPPLVHHQATNRVRARSLTLLALTTLPELPQADHI
jgi:hypothetical protein